jgi:molybdopterin converting factor small subunit
MRIRIKLIGAFRTDRFKEKEMELQGGATAEEIVAALNIPGRALGTVLVNGVHARRDEVLNDGDTLSLLPILGGG